MPKQPQFRTLRPYRDYISARDWNALTAAVMRLCRSLGVAGIFDASGLHIRPARSKHWPPYYKIVSHDGEGVYTLRPQKWNETDKVFEDLPDANDITAYEIGGDTSGSADDIVVVRMELSVEGEWIGLFEIASVVSWGVAYQATPWSTGDKYVMLHPCSNYEGDDEDTETEIKAYVFGIFYDVEGTPTGKAPDGLEVDQGDVLAYLPIGGDEAILVSPPLRLPPCTTEHLVLCMQSGTAYDYDFGPVCAIGGA